jgi:acyl-homoserine lactone acylase PvdQ
MGVIFTQYYSPSMAIPFGQSRKMRYGMIGATYLAVYEFGDKIRGATALNFGVSGDPKSPHYFDQAKLLADHKLKPELFYWDDVRASAVRVYHPGQTPEAVAKK